MPENHKPDATPQQPPETQAEFMVGALIGAVAGAAAALLLTPKSGKEMRHTVKEYAKEFEGEAYELAKEAKDVTKSLRQAIDEGVTTFAENAPEKAEKVSQQAQVITATLEQHITAARDSVTEIAEAFRSGWEEYGETIEQAKEQAAQQEADASAAQSQDIDMPVILAQEEPPISEEQGNSDSEMPQLEEDHQASPVSTDQNDEPPVAPLQSRRRGQTSHLLADEPIVQQEEQPESEAPATVRPMLASQEIDEIPADDTPKESAYTTKIIEEVKPNHKEDQKPDQPKPTKTRSVKVEIDPKPEAKSGKKLFFRKK